MCRQPEDDDIAKGRCLLDQGLTSEAIQYFDKLRERHPQSAQVHLHSAYIYDRIGKEEEAIPLYEQAMRLGLKQVDARDAHVCLASSLRNVGKSHDGFHLLDNVRTQFPKDVVFELFLALLATEIDRPYDAIRTLVKALLRESRADDLGRYRNVIRGKFNRLLDDITSRDTT